MSYLPKCNSQFSDKEFWDSVFVKRGDTAFDWYGEYAELSPIFRKYVRPCDQILVVGCGNSDLSSNLYDDGCYNITNIDISDIIIKKMQGKNYAKRPKMIWKTMDVKEMTFEDGSFNVILDKGTLDALMTDETEAVRKTIEKMFMEIERVLQMGGRFICVSLLQIHILKFFLTWFGSEGWLVRFHRCFQAEESCKQNGNKLVFPVFVAICTKLKKTPGLKSILELSLDNTVPVKVKECQNVICTIQALQEYAFVRNKLANGTVENGVFLELCTSTSEEPRYTLFVVDRNKKFQMRFAVFLVPQGRETEWLFATDEGRLQLSDNCNSQRLIVVHLNRNHSYDSFESVKSELSSEIIDLAPKELPPNAQIPFLSVGEDIGVRTIVCKDSSEYSGEFIIEDVESENKQLFRRLIFKSNLNVIQSEAKLKIANKKGKKKIQIDHNYLAWEYHQLMIAGLAFTLEHVEEITKADVLIIGLGGGGLPMYIYTNFPKFTIDVVEIDKKIVETAATWFGFIESRRTRVHIKDGLEMIYNASKSGSKYDVIVLDVDNKDNTTGLSCPPEAFVEESKLLELKSILKDNGCCVINLVCRNEDLKNIILAKLKNVFPRRISCKIQDEVNEIIYCFKATEKNLIPLMDSSKKFKKFLKNDEILEHLMSNMKLL